VNSAPAYFYDRLALNYIFQEGSLKSLINDIYLCFIHAAMPGARFEAEWLVAQVLNLDRYHYLLFPEHLVSSKQQKIVYHALLRRLKGEPLIYIVNSCLFFDLHFQITSDVLIPRSETEELIEFALQWSRSVTKKNPRGLDLGTGSGCIGISLAKKLPTWSFCASDISSKALALAQENAKINHVALDFRLGDWLEPWSDNTFDLIVCNPPYISESEKDQVSSETFFYEPSLALFADEEGLMCYRLLSETLLEHLNPGGVVIFEMGFAQAADIKLLFDAPGWGKRKILKDMSYKDRFFFIERE
jgi:release factor glutamine methyltransferase